MEIDKERVAAEGLFYCLPWMHAAIAREAEKDATVIAHHDTQQARIAALEARCATLTAEVMHYTAGMPHPLEARCRELQARTGPDFLQMWMRATNPMLGGAVPIEMMRKGLGVKVAAFIDSALAAELAADFDMETKVKQGEQG